MSNTVPTAGEAMAMKNWEFDAAGLMQRRFACINDLPIAEADRRFRWPLGRPRMITQVFRISASGQAIAGLVRILLPSDDVGVCTLGGGAERTNSEGRPMAELAKRSLRSGFSMSGIRDLVGRAFTITSLAAANDWRDIEVLLPKRLEDGSFADGLLKRRFSEGVWCYRRVTAAEEHHYRVERDL